MPTFSNGQLMRMTVEIFKAAGATENEAKCVTEHLLESNLVGHDSHGIMRVPEYCEMIEKGEIKTSSEFKIIHETPSTAVIDGGWGFGQVIAKNAMEIAINKAKSSTVSAIGVRHANHIGRLGYYSMMAANHDMIGIVACNTAPGMAPYGGVERVLSTNPISVAVPAGKREPFLLDFATSVVSGGKVLVALEKGEKIPYGWMLDKNGLSTNDPEAFSKGGVYLPFGGYKGYALALLIDILGGALTGHGCASQPEYKGGNGTLMMAINISAFTPIEEFKEGIDGLFNTIKQSKKASGFEEILIPGELEFRTREKRRKEGVFIPDKTWQKIEALANKFKLDINKLIRYSLNLETGVWFESE